MKVCCLLYMMIDVDNSDSLEECQIRSLLMYLTNMRQLEMATLFYKLDLDQSGAIELEEFFLLISLLLANKDKKEKEFMHAHSKTVFELLDDDGSDTLSAEEFQRLAFLFNLDNQAINLIFQDFDVSGDAALDYGEFRMFTLACIDNQKSAKKERLENLLQRRTNFLAEQRRSVLNHINKTINDCVPGLLIYESGDTLPRYTLPADVRFRRRSARQAIEDSPRRQSAFRHVLDFITQRRSGYETPRRRSNRISMLPMDYTIGEHSKSSLFNARRQYSTQMDRTSTPRLSPLFSSSPYLNKSPSSRQNGRFLTTGRVESNK
ncbi:unnamed protein product [Didymodactylos carnosus]|uniref:EF-hand domain-containing protein n=1 Tax=Didymodactylos carnosus TaxID=1234261 RepID=A0A814HIE1_9BILA|nr:unnamed protein product [Didymodactylos carnosus]CAF1011430.1 unnamed protein product [Didymodactylos carnosus]CAF3603006.1 unnamed protein product [Didymodactylos carnosus]CAF3782766.1 unnamed protein product [Didymodactylos carnosus]